MANVIHGKYLPIRPPFLLIAVAWLVVDRFEADSPSWAMAVFCTLAGVLVLAWIIAAFSQTDVHPRDV